MGDKWQVVACRTVRRFPWFRSEPESVVLYDGVTELQAQTLALLLNRQDMGVTYEARNRESEQRR